MTPFRAEVEAELRTLLAESGIEPGAVPELEAEIARLLGPEAPASLADLARAMPRRPAYLGPEAWLAAIRNADRRA
jgi:hypothetical protein